VGKPEQHWSPSSQNSVSTGVSDESNSKTVGGCRGGNIQKPCDAMRPNRKPAESSSFNIARSAASMSAGRRASQAPSEGARSVQFGTQMASSPHPQLRFSAGSDGEPRQGNPPLHRQRQRRKRIKIPRPRPRGELFQKEDLGVRIAHVEAVRYGKVVADS